MAKLEQPTTNGFDIGALAPAGTYVATCLDIEDQFGVDRPKFENPQETEKLDVTRFLFGFNSQDGQTYKVQSFEFRISGSPKSNLIKFLTSWLGHAPKYGWDYCELKAQGAMITVAHKQSRDLTKTYANIVGISPVIDQLKAQVLPVEAFGQTQTGENPAQPMATATPQAAYGQPPQANTQATTPPQALEIPIDDHERDEAGRGDPLGIEQAKTRTLVSSAVASHELKVFTAVSGAVAAEGGVGAWSGAANDKDPIAEIDAQIETLATDTGMMPNRMVIGLPAWAAIRHNPQVIARFPGAASVGVTRNQFASLLLNPDLDIRIGVLSHDENKWGKEKSAKNIVGSELYLFHGNNAPTLYDPCFMKTFRTRRGGVDVVRTYREESSRSDVLAVDWTEDIKLTSAISAKRITVS